MVDGEEAYALKEFGLKPSYQLPKNLGPFRSFFWCKHDQSICLRQPLMKLRSE